MTARWEYARLTRCTREPNPQERQQDEEAEALWDHSPAVPGFEETPYPEPIPFQAPTRWEIVVELPGSESSTHPDDLVSVLNEYGDDGWELVQSTATASSAGLVGDDESVSHVVEEAFILKRQAAASG